MKPRIGRLRLASQREAERNHVRGALQSLRLVHHGLGDCWAFGLGLLDPGVQAEPRKHLFREPADDASFEGVR
jgi:hypothetical protein